VKRASYEIQQAPGGSLKPFTAGGLQILRAPADSRHLVTYGLITTVQNPAEPTGERYKWSMNVFALESQTNCTLALLPAGV
jgi:hypothetical protein